MNVSRILHQLTKLRVIEIARALGLDTQGRKGEIVTRVARSLARRHGEDGQPQGWQVALEQLLDVLNDKDAPSLIQSLAPWQGHEAEYEVTETLWELDPDDCLELLKALCIGDNSSTHEIDSICQDQRWEGVFEAIPYEEEDAGEEDAELPGDLIGDEDADTDDPVAPGEYIDSGEPVSVAALEEDEETQWQLELVYDAGPELPLPEGLTLSVHQLFPHQERSLAALRRWWASDIRRGVLCLPTGSGKTRTAVEFALTHAVRHQKRVLWLAHRHELVDQAIAAFLSSPHRRSISYTISRFERGQRRYEESPTDVVVASLPTLSWRRDLPNLDRLLATHEQFDLIVIDECHHSVAKSWKRLLKELRRRMPRSKVLGLSATPTRTAQRERPGLWKLFSSIIHEESPLPLIQAGILARPHINSIETQRTFEASEEEVRLFRKFDDLPPALVQRIAEDRVRNELIVQQLVQQRERWGQTLLFAASIDHAKRLREMLRKKGMAAEFLHGGSSVAERSQVLSDFAARKFQVLLNVSLLTEGTDIPAVQTVFLARPTTSRILFQQMVGRGLRGPQLGGTAVCYVVGFHDRVTNLMHEQLTSRFTTEQEALTALGFDSGNEVSGPEQAAATGFTSLELVGSPLPSVAPADFQQRLTELLRAVEAMRLKGEWAPEELPLVGWWETSAQGQYHYLLTFRADISASGSPLGWLSQLSQASKTLSEQEWALRYHVTWERFKAFSEAMVSSRGKLRYVDLSQSSAAEVRLVIESVLGPAQVDTVSTPQAPPAPSRPPLEFWISRAAHADTARGEVLVRVGGKLQSLTQANYEGVRSVWEAHRDLLGSRPEPAAIELFVKLALRLPGAADVPADLCQQLLTEAARIGELPPLLPESERGPTLGEVREGIRGMDNSRRREALTSLYQTYFTAQFPSQEQFFLELLMN